MDYLDIRINELISKSEEHLLRSSQPHGFLGLSRSLRHGRVGWVGWLTGLMHLVLFVLAVRSGLAFFSATETADLVRHGLVAATSLIVAVQLLTAMSPHMHAERILRRLKRIEILILANRGAG